MKMLEWRKCNGKSSKEGSGGQACRTAGDFFCSGIDDNFCVPSSLKCDGVANCRNGADENRSLAKCGKSDRSLFGKIFSLGVSASIAIVAGSILCFIVCLAGTICCCFRCSRTRQKNAAAAAGMTVNSGAPRAIPVTGAPPPGATISASGSTGADSVYVGGGFLPMMTMAGGGPSLGERGDFPSASHKYYSVNGHYSTSSGGTASPYNYKKNAPPSLASSGYQALVYNGSKSFSAASGAGISGHGEVPLNHPHACLGPAHPASGNGGYPSSIYSYQSSHSSAAHAPPTYRDSLLSSTGGGRMHSPTSSRSGRSLRSSVTYHAYNPTPSLVNPDERIEYPVQL